MRRQKADRLLKAVLEEIRAEGKLSLRTAVVCRDGQIEAAWQAAVSPRIMTSLIQLCCDEVMVVATLAVCGYAGRKKFGEPKQKKYDRRQNAADAIRRVVPAMTLQMLLGAVR